MSHTCLPLAPCLHSGCSRCLFSLSFAFCLILLSVSVSMLLFLFCAPSVGWLHWLFSFLSLSVHRGRLLLFSFIFGPYLRCIASVVCLGSLSATSLSLPFSVSVPLLSLLLSSARPTTFAFAAPLSFTASVAVVSVERYRES